MVLADGVLSIETSRPTGRSCHTTLFVVHAVSLCATMLPYAYRLGGEHTWLSRWAFVKPLAVAIFALRGLQLSHAEMLFTEPRKMKWARIHDYRGGRDEYATLGGQLLGHPYEVQGSTRRGKEHQERASNAWIRSIWVDAPIVLRRFNAPGTTSKYFNTAVHRELVHSTTCFFARQYAA